MEVLKTLFTARLIATLLIAANASAQVSNVEGIEPMDGVAIPKAQISQPQSVKPGAVFKDCDECPEMVVIPAGSFLMGSPSDPEQDPFSDAKLEKISEADEKPQHQVNIQSFAIGRYEVTQEQWYAVMGNNPSKNKGRTLPVENVSWDDAQLFVQKLSQKTGKKYRLPTEAEWEYAARGGSTTTYPWGNNDTELHAYAWFSKTAKATNAVGLKKPNQFGLHDMLGNVWEWTQDCWNWNYSDAPTDGNAWTRGDCSRRVLRGGSSHSSPYVLRTSKRDSHTPAGRFESSGFRVVIDLLKLGAQVSNVEGIERMEGVVIPKAQPVQSITQAHSSNPKVKFITSAGEFVVEVYPDKTPKTVENFLGYVRDGHYNSTLFHRVINNFMIQGGGYDTKYNEKYTRPPIKHEGEQAKVNGALRNTVGTISMARTNNPHSATAQFFINVKDNDFLDHQAPTAQGWGYVVFGKVISGMDVINRIKITPTGPGGPFPIDVPQTPVVIQSATLLN